MHIHKSLYSKLLLHVSEYGPWSVQLQWLTRYILNIDLNIFFVPVLFEFFAARLKYKQRQRGETESFISTQSFKFCSGLDFFKCQKMFSCHSAVDSGPGDNPSFGLEDQMRPGWPDEFGKESSKIYIAFKKILSFYFCQLRTMTMTMTIPFSCDNSTAMDNP
jgi:hypothetical protein